MFKVIIFFLTISFSCINGNLEKINKARESIYSKEDKEEIIENNENENENDFFSPEELEEDQIAEIIHKEYKSIDNIYQNSEFFKESVKNFDKKIINQFKKNARELFFNINSLESLIKSYENFEELFYTYFGREKTLTNKTCKNYDEKRGYNPSTDKCLPTDIYRYFESKNIYNLFYDFYVATSSANFRKEENLCFINKDYLQDLINNKYPLNRELFILNEKKYFTLKSGSEDFYKNFEILDQEKMKGLVDSILLTGKNSQHNFIYGKPGSGKTTVAECAKSFMKKNEINFYSMQPSTLYAIAYFMNSGDSFFDMIVKNSSTEKIKKVIKKEFFNMPIVNKIIEMEGFIIKSMERNPSVEHTNENIDIFLSGFNIDFEEDYRLILKSLKELENLKIVNNSIVNSERKKLFKDFEDEINEIISSNNGSKKFLIRESFVKFFEFMQKISDYIENSGLITKYINYCENEENPSENREEMRSYLKFYCGLQGVKSIRNYGYRNDEGVGEANLEEKIFVLMDNILEGKNTDHNQKNLHIMIDEANCFLTENFRNNLFEALKKLYLSKKLDHTAESKMLEIKNMSIPEPDIWKKVIKGFYGNSKIKFMLFSNEISDFIKNFKRDEIERINFIELNEYLSSSDAVKLTRFLFANDNKNKYLDKDALCQFLDNAERNFNESKQKEAFFGQDIKSKNRAILYKRFSEGVFLKAKNLIEELDIKNYASKEKANIFYSFVNVFSVINYLESLNRKKYSSRDEDEIKENISLIIKNIDEYRKKNNFNIDSLNKSFANNYLKLLSIINQNEK